MTDKSTLGKRSNSRKEVLWVHAGGAKAGSSALQNSLEYIEEWLAQRGIAYENRVGLRHSLQITSGNGMLLYRTLTAAVFDELALRSLIRSYLGDHRQGVCSCEALTRLNVIQWRKLAEACGRLRIELHVIYYARNVLEQVLAQYDQDIKHHREWREFRAWSKGFHWVDASTLKALVQIIPRECLHVLHFNSCRGELLRSFLRILGVETDDSRVLGKANLQVNRSLTNFERARLKEINKSFGYLLTDKLADQLLYCGGNAVPEPVVPPRDVVKDLERRVRGDLRWLNGRFFPDGDGVLFQTPGTGRKEAKSRKAESPAGTPKGGDAAAIVERVTAEWALDQLAMSRLQTFQWVATVLQRISKPSQIDAELPADFDPIAYLFRNFDLLAAGVEPHAHFKESGHKEGRAWSWAESGSEEE